MIKRFFLLILILICVPFLYLLFLISPTSLSGEKISFVVPLDEKQENIVRKLKNENFIRSERLFNFVAGMMRFPGTVEPGAYLLSHTMTLIDISDILLNKPYQRWAVIVPGLRVEQTAEKLAKKFNWDTAKTKEFLDHAREGYMFPDTYLLNVDYTGKEFAQRLIANFNEKFDAKMQADLLAQNVRNDTAIKIASLIERESGGEEDKALIAGIIWNRLNQGMRLEIDATIQYAIGTPADWWPLLSGGNLRSIDSPFNTYKIKSLPPSPIASPSLSSIRAAIYPAETDCLFYLHDRAKAIHCSKTYAEHLENIERYLK